MTDKYQPTRQICVRQPAIVLMNPENAGSLLAKPNTLIERQNAAYWKSRATIYVIGNVHFELY